MAERKISIIHQGEKHEGADVPITSMQETVSTYELEDGTVLTLRTVVVNAIRIDAVRNAQGEPTYVVKSQNIVSASVPDNLRKPMG